jgi:hypothetical protein
MCKSIPSTLLAVFILLSTSISSARTVTILPFSGDSVHPQIRSAAKDALSIFLSDHKEDIRGNRLTEGGQTRGEANDVAKAVNATHYIEGRITRLGRRAIVQVARYEVGQPSPEHTDRMTAANPTDLEVVMQRLAMSLATGERAKVNEEIDTVSQRDQAPLRRRVANHYVGVNLGGAMLSLDGAELLPGFGVSWLFDNREVLFGAEFRGYGMGSTSQGYYEFALGGYYPFSQKSMTPYIGGGMALSGASVEERVDSMDGSALYTEHHDDVGLSIFAAAGLLIGRTSTVSLRPEIGYSVGTYSVASEFVHGPRFGITLGF